MELKPSRILWVVNIGMSTISLVEDHAEESYRILFDKALRGAVYQRWGENQKSGLPILGKTESSYHDWFNAHKQKIESLDLDLVETSIQKFSFLDEIETLNFVPRLVANPRLNIDMGNLCKEFAIRGIQLNLIISPTPRAELWESGYPEEFLTQFSTQAELFREHTTCAKTVLAKPLKDWGIDVRHFLNQVFDDEFDYESFEDFESYWQTYQELDKEKQRTFYDVHHLNPLGAQLFTRKVMQEIQ
ncbi:hypothetical protein N9K16_06715 [Alphaproteobacteria bacterium]|nr:hypothetical protein [Alphaproteobacteria bacterium]